MLTSIYSDNSVLLFGGVQSVRPSSEFPLTLTLALAITDHRITLFSRVVRRVLLLVGPRSVSECLRATLVTTDHRKNLAVTERYVGACRPSVAHGILGDYLTRTTRTKGVRLVRCLVGETGYSNLKLRGNHVSYSVLRSVLSLTAVGSQDRIIGFVLFSYSNLGSPYMLSFLRASLLRGTTSGKDLGALRLLLKESNGSRRVIDASLLRTRTLSVRRAIIRSNRLRALVCLIRRGTDHSGSNPKHFSVCSLSTGNGGLLRITYTEKRISVIHCVLRKSYETKRIVLTGISPTMSSGSPLLLTYVRKRIDVMERLLHGNPSKGRVCPTISTGAHNGLPVGVTTRRNGLRIVSFLLP